MKIAHAWVSSGALGTEVEGIKSSSFSYGYSIAASCFGIQAIGVGAYVCYGVFFNPLIAEFVWSQAALSGASSMPFFLMGLFGIIAFSFLEFVGR